MHPGSFVQKGGDVVAEVVYRKRRTTDKNELAFEEKVRTLMNKQRITYQEAERLTKAGQKSIFEF
ncbi:hypothetical protein HY772_00995 [Candidatus Woesearchaeota archaeon]|nr:hypothetical protein [Candidatus Woesearchaeota archaeon]